MTRFCLPALLLAALCCPAAEPAPSQATGVAPEVAALLTAVREAIEPVKDVELIQAYKGPDHALIRLALGNALLELKRADEAKAAYNAALTLDPALRQAHFGLARIAADAQDWKGALRELGPAVDVTSVDRGPLVFFAQCAVQAEDWRLAGTLATIGMTRFPEERSFRRIDLALLIRSGRSAEARTAILALLDEQPTEVDQWRNLAWTASRPDGDVQDLLAAIELASLAAPADATLKRQLADARLANHLPRAALAVFRELAAGSQDGALMEAAARAAAEAGEPAEGRAFLARVPADKRTRNQRLLAARLALQGEDPAGAVASLKELIDLGERDPQVLAWAGQLAEQQGDAAGAEAFYQQAASPAATLRLIALYVRQERTEEAAVLLATYLAKQPDDAQAKALQAHLLARAKAK